MDAILKSAFIVDHGYQSARCLGTLIPLGGYGCKRSPYPWIQDAVGGGRAHLKYVFKAHVAVAWKRFDVGDTTA